MHWQAMMLLGAYHGINPGMGWLFAVALGLQQGSARGVWLALPPIALGHAAAVGGVLLVAGLAQIVIPDTVLTIIVAVALITLGCYRLWRHGHPRFGGMQVGFRDLTIWSFLMAWAHGAGLMLLPFVMGQADTAHATGEHAHDVAASGVNGITWSGSAALGIHTATYLLVMTLAAWIVYRKLGLRLLRTAWFNLDWFWAGALVLTGAIVLLQ
jgi:hypothetical protein